MHRGDKSLFYSIKNLAEDVNYIGNKEDKLRSKGKEHVKAIELRSGKVLSSLENPTLEVVMEKTDDPQDESLEAEKEPRPKEVKTPSVEPEKETPKDAEITKIPFPSRLEEK
ncbi:parathymosin-like [Gossypium australe]|uniref:Parathymosin-like n=1 Tax=Gossypium australe TaxID=47621 RepID=A0A5B6WRK6_9ROSI|nr:parathymosin-like [Gossypium australe]